MAPHSVDVVVVSYNSAAYLRRCVASLVGLDGVQIVVVDNSSRDGSLETVADLPVTSVSERENGGFARACNTGYRRGSAPNVLFLNPDATIDERSLARLEDALAQDERLAAVAPRIEYPDGSLALSVRRFPRLRSTYARALFLHRMFPHATWTDEIVRDPALYRRRHLPEWVSGACILVRRSALDAVGGWDDGFFLYCEDIDLCRRLWGAGYQVRFEPDAVAVHVEGAFSENARTLPLLAASRIRYAQKHRSRAAAALERLGIALDSVTHIAFSRAGPGARRGHARSLRVALSPRRGRISARTYPSG